MLLDVEGTNRMRRVVRHRLLNFVSGIKSANSLLATELDSRLLPQEREYFPMILKECDLIAAMAERLDALFAVLPEPAPGSLKNALSSILCDVRGLHPTAEVALDVAPSIYSANRMVCTRALRILLMESIANAHEFSRKPVNISIVEDGGACSVRILDQGKALSAEVRAMVFEPFFTTHPRHVGVGMSIAKRIVEARGGAASVSSGENGNCFEFILPYMQGCD